MDSKKFYIALLMIISIAASSKLFAEDNGKKSPENFSGAQISRSIMSIGPEFSIPLYNKDNGYLAGGSFTTRMFFGNSGLFFRTGFYAHQFLLVKETHLGSVISAGYRFEQLKHMAFDLLLGANIDWQIGKNFKMKKGPYVGIAPEFIISFPAQYNYDVGIFFRPVLNVGSMDYFRKSRFLMGVTFNIKTRSLVKKLPWSE
jgi:hypothetical protein